MAKTTKKQKSKAASSSRESKYVDSIDFRSWWESFRFDINKNGTQKYKTVWQFITTRTKVGWQRDLLYWMLGPKVEGDPASPYSKFEQFDWDDKLKKGVWYASDNIEKLHRSLDAKHNAMSKLAELGGVNVDFIARLQNILATIDSEFGGRLQLPDLSRKANEARIDLYMKLNRQVLDMLREAQVMYGKTQGVDLVQLTQFIGMFGKGMGQVAGMGQILGLNTSDAVSEEDSKHKDAFSKILDMVVTKSANYDLQLPDKKMEEILVDSRKPKLVKGSIQ